MVKDKTGHDETRRAVQRLFDETRRRLVETGTRNRLVHVNRASTRGNVLNVADARSDDVYELLAGGALTPFLPARPGRTSEVEGSNALVLPGAQDGADALQTRLEPEALQKKLLKIAREAQTAEEESGVNILYLALGFLTWFEDESSNTAREAPLVLLPVELARNVRTSSYELRRRQDDILTNLPLQQRLHDDFGIDLPELDVEEEWRPWDYFAAVSTATASRKRWKIDSDAIHLGFFSFNKLLMYRDLAVDAWSEDALATHSLTRGLLYEGFEGEEPALRPEDRLDDVLPPEKLFHVVDADASQATVIEEARRGRNLVVQGPPGTGKSQTITNIIAAAASEGKRVLFLAEKMAALSVVYERLVKSGLRDVCLELHSKTANKKSTLGEIARTLSQATATPNIPGPPTALKEARDRLNALANLLHRQIGTSGETPYSVIGRQSLFLGTGRPPPSLDSDAITALSREQEASVAEIVRIYGGLSAAELNESPHPFEGVRNLDLQPVDLRRLEGLARERVLVRSVGVAHIRRQISPR
jgi:Protein of unknown function (DUF4011)/AAA domain